MSLFFALESLKLHRTKREHLMQVLFVALLLVQFGVTYLFADSIEMINQFLVKATESLTTGALPTDLLLKAPPVFWYYILAEVFLMGVNLWASWGYIWLHVGSILPKESRRGPVPVIGLMLLMTVFYGALFFLSSFLLLIPFVVLGIFTYYVFPYYLHREVSLGKAINFSYRASKTHFGAILVTNIFLFFLGNLFRMFVSGIFPGRTGGMVLVFVVTLLSLARGRLVAILYLTFCVTPASNVDNAAVVRTPEELLALFTQLRKREDGEEGEPLIPSVPPTPPQEPLEPKRPFYAPPPIPRAPEKQQGIPDAPKAPDNPPAPEAAPDPERPPLAPGEPKQENKTETETESESAPKREE